MDRAGPLVAIEVMVEVAVEQDVGVSDALDVDPDRNPAASVVKWMPILGVAPA
jgi:hypothetical protein